MTQQKNERGSFVDCALKHGDQADPELDELVTLRQQLVEAQSELEETHTSLGEKVASCISLKARAERAEAEVEVWKLAAERIVRYERLEKYLTRKNTPEEDAIEALTVGVPRQELVNLLGGLIEANAGGYYWVEKGLTDATAACKKWLGIKDEPVIEPEGNRE